jgi:hypothetical protein
MVKIAPIKIMVMIVIMSAAFEINSVPERDLVYWLKKFVDSASILWC